MSRLTLSLSLALAIPFTASLAGCFTEGDRAEHGCPDDEICSDWTPDGLHFDGAGFFEVGVTAVGGTQRIDVLTWDEEDGYEDYELGYDARMSDPSVFAVGDGAELEVRALSAGTARLRLLEPGTELLLDRVQLEARPVAQVALGVSGITGEGVLWEDVEVDVGVQLYAADDTRLVDESAVASGPAVGRASGWDEFRTAPLAAGDHDVTIVAGGQTFTASVSVVDDADGLRPFEPPSSIAVDGEEATFCVVGTNEGREILGRAVSLEVEGTAAVLTNADDDGGATFCALLRPVEVGSVRIRATLGSATQTYELSVVEGSDAGGGGGASSEPIRAGAAPTPGERAGG